MDLILFFKENITFFKEIGLLIFGGIGSFVALQGLSTWKRQLKGKDEYELCKRILIDLYQYRKGIKVVRNPMMFSSEGYNEDLKGLDFEEKSYKITVNAYQNRWEKILDSRIKLDLDLIESKIYWDDKLEDLFKPIFEFENKLFRKIQDTLILKNPNQDDEYKRVVGKNFHETDGDYILYFLGDDDKYEKELNSNISKIEYLIKNKLKK